MKEVIVKVPALFHTGVVELPLDLPFQSDGEAPPAVEFLAPVVYHPRDFTILFGDIETEIPLHRVSDIDLKHGGVGHVYYKGESLGSVELLNGELIINDPEDPALIYVEDILKDLV